MDAASRCRTAGSDAGVPRPHPYVPLLSFTFSPLLSWGSRKETEAQHRAALRPPPPAPPPPPPLQGRLPAEAPRSAAPRRDARADLQWLRFPAGGGAGEQRCPTRGAAARRHTTKGTRHTRGTRAHTESRAALRNLSPEQSNGSRLHAALKAAACAGCCQHPGAALPPPKLSVGLIPSEAFFFFYPEQKEKARVKFRLTFYVG